MRKSFYAFLLLSFVLLLAACKGEQKPQEVPESGDPRVDATMQRTEGDSLEIIQLTREYLTKLQNKDIDGALAMVYNVDSTGVRPISDEQRAEMRKTLEMFPVLDFEITQMLLFSDDDTEVRYKVKFFELTPEMEGMQNTIKQAIQPRRYEGKWYVTVPNVMVENNY